ncbi:MAG: ribosomal protein S18-alanine N-acetyltransferase [Clostridia bacterium]|nr:ribosomal protein S18-alanine N-acetyltransferase [Clostridia bacterium]
MNPSDVPAVSRMEAENFAVPWRASDVEDAVSSVLGANLVAVENDTVVGYLLGQAFAPEGELFRIAVANSHRRRGIGKAICDAFFDELTERDVTDVFLEVRSRNEAAIALYRSLGFSPTGRRKDYYKNPTDDAVLMAVSLPERKKKP